MILRLLTGYVSKELKLVDYLSHTEIRNIPKTQDKIQRQSKITLGNSTESEYHLKKED